MSVKTQNTLELSFSTNFEKIASEVKPQIFILFWTVLLPIFTVFAYIHFVKLKFSWQCEKCKAINLTLRKKRNF